MRYSRNQAHKLWTNYQAIQHVIWTLLKASNFTEACELKRCINFKKSIYTKYNLISQVDPKPVVSAGNSIEDYVFKNSINYNWSYIGNKENFAIFYKFILYYKVLLKTIINHDNVTTDSYDKNLLPEEHGIKCFVFVFMFLIEPFCS